jgi:hypothetical protein
MLTVKRPYGGTVQEALVHPSKVSARPFCVGVCWRVVLRCSSACADRVRQGCTLRCTVRYVLSSALRVPALRGHSLCPGVSHASPSLLCWRVVFSTCCRYIDHSPVKQLMAPCVRGNSSSIAILKSSSTN